MGLLEKMAEARPQSRGSKSFVEPPFWNLDQLRFPFLSTLPNRERIENDFEGYVHGAYKTNGVVFACILTRMAIFSQARFLWREFRQGRPGQLFGTEELALLEQPWPGGTTGELLARMEVDVSLAGNFYATTADDAGRLGRAARGPNLRIAHLRPDWVTIILSSASGDPHDVDTQPVGYLYQPPAGSGSRPEPVTLLPNEVVHYSPIPDPIASFRGMSWITPVLREITADKAATQHKRKFFENGASLNTVMKLDKDVGPDAFDDFVEKFRAQHEGSDNAYKTLFVGGGADVSVVGSDLRQLEFKATQGAGETRIAADSGIHPVILGLSEGLQGSSLNAGNFNAARRLTADKTLRWLWQVASASLQTLVTPPSDGASLWYDDRDIPFLREDEADLAAIREKDAMTLRNLVEAGYEPDAAVDYVVSDDLRRMRGNHTGVFSVQLQPPGTSAPAPSGDGETTGE